MLLCNQAVTPLTTLFKTLIHFAYPSNSPRATIVVQLVLNVELGPWLIHERPSPSAQLHFPRGGLRHQPPRRRSASHFLDGELVP
jgi:hypothetical protein